MIDECLIVVIEVEKSHVGSKIRLYVFQLTEESFIICCYVTGHIDSFVTIDVAANLISFLLSIYPLLLLLLLLFLGESRFSRISSFSDFSNFSTFSDFCRFCLVYFIHLELSLLSLIWLLSFISLLSL